MRRRFGGYFYTLCFRLPDEIDRARGADVCNVHPAFGLFGDCQVAGHNFLFPLGRSAVRFFAVVDYRQIEHFTDFQCFFHQFRCSQRVAVITESDNSCFYQRLHVNQGFPLSALGDAPDREYLYQTVAFRFVF